VVPAPVGGPVYYDVHPLLLCVITFIYLSRSLTPFNNGSRRKKHTLRDVLPAFEAMILRWEKQQARHPETTHIVQNGIVTRSVHISWRPRIAAGLGSVCASLLLQLGPKSCQENQLQQPTIFALTINIFPIQGSVYHVSMFSLPEPRLTPSDAIVCT
jgi:hypothetical protein